MNEKASAFSSDHQQNTQFSANTLWFYRNTTYSGGGILEERYPPVKAQLQLFKLLRAVREPPSCL